jgi:1,2-phenylacetyl-CoA epoxidase PaaB subunit
MNLYTVEVKYRTKSGLGQRHVAVRAADVEEALRVAKENVRRSRGVVRIDSAEWRDAPRASAAARA